MTGPYLLDLGVAPPGAAYRLRFVGPPESERVLYYRSGDDYDILRVRSDEGDEQWVAPAVDVDWAVPCKVCMPDSLRGLIHLACSAQKQPIDGYGAPVLQIVRRVLTSDLGYDYDIHLQKGLEVNQSDAIRQIALDVCGTLEAPPPGSVAIHRPQGAFYELTNFELLSLEKEMDTHRVALALRWLARKASLSPDTELHRGASYILRGLGWLREEIEDAL